MCPLQLGSIDTAAAAVVDAAKHCHCLCTHSLPLVALVCLAIRLINALASVPPVWFDIIVEKESIISPGASSTSSSAAADDRR